MTTKTQIEANRLHALKLVAMAPRRPSELRDYGVRRGVMATLAAYGLVEYQDGCSRYFTTPNGRAVLARLIGLSAVEGAL